MKARRDSALKSGGDFIPLPAPCGERTVHEIYQHRRTTGPNGGHCCLNGLYPLGASLQDTAGPSELIGALGGHASGKSCESVGLQPIARSAFFPEPGAATAAESTASPASIPTDKQTAKANLGWRCMEASISQSRAAIVAPDPKQRPQNPVIANENSLDASGFIRNAVLQFAPRGELMRVQSD